MNYVRFCFPVLASLALLGCVSAAETITLKYPGGSARGEVIRVSDSEVVLKSSAGKEQVIPVAFLQPKDIYYCKKTILDLKDAQGHFDLGKFCMDKGLKQEAEELLKFAASVDPAKFKLQVEELLGAKELPAPVAEAPKATEPPKTTETPEATTKPPASDSEGTKDDETVEVRGPDGRIFRIPKKFVANNEEIAPRKPDEWAKFKEDRQQELKRVCGGDWKFEETEHYLLFSNLDDAEYQQLKVHCEGLYRFLSEVMDYKEGELLWNNKCPIYFIKTRNQFNKFAVQIDQAPGAQVSGGYFRHRGREVHIVIPLYDWMNGKQRIETAISTLYHEGTHAFLQLVGKNATIDPWLHEGMAQFIEFLLMERFLGSPNLQDRNRAVMNLRQAIKDNDVISWDEGRMRPAGGGDLTGYAFAWSRIHFLYTCFISNRRALPTMIKAIKDGKDEKEAAQAAFGMSWDRLEQGYRTWMDTASKKNFK